MIKVASGFQYSVNIGYDVGNPAKIRSYIPTDAFVALSHDMIASLESYTTDRSRIVIGPYGTGKSHLITVLASILKKSLEPAQYDPLVERLRNFGYGDFVPRFRQFIDEQPYLTVILNGNGRRLEQALTHGLQQSLLEAGIEDLMPRTAFQAVSETLLLWEKQYPRVFAEFKKLLSSEYNELYADFLVHITECELDSLEVFRSIFPRLSAGAEFSLYDTKDIPDLYREVSILLRRRGYKGIYIIFDEFNKFLEASLQQKEVLDLKLLQDLAEMCNRSADDQVHLMLISHQHISQYAMRLPDELLDTWRKVEGRFTAVNIRRTSAKTYQLISTVIEKNPELWETHQSSHHGRFSSLVETTKEHGLFEELSDDEIERWIVKGCYPLHPSTVFSLPRVSNRLAQNERTLFTFLATKDFDTLGEFLDETNQADFQMLTLDVLFDYFFDLAQKQRNQDSLGKSFLRAKEGIGKLGSAPEPMATKILKCLGVMIGLEEPSFPPTLQNLRFCLVYNDGDLTKFDKCFRNLIEAKVIYERRSDGRIQFLTGSDIDFRAAMDGIRGDYRYNERFRTDEILNEFFAPYPVIANRYNDQYEMTRFFYQEFFSADDIIRGIDWDEYLQKKQYADGVVAYVLAESEEQLQAITDSKTRAQHQQVVFVIPKTPMKGISELAFDFMALDILKRDKVFWEQDPLGLVELNAYLGDYEEQIEGELAYFVGNRGETSQVIYKGEEQHVRSSTALSQFVSHICSSVFKDTPKINNELINRVKVSKAVVNARKRVVGALLTGIEEVNLGLKGYGPDVSIFRSLLKRTGVYREHDGKVEIEVDERVNEDFREVIGVIQTALHSDSSEPVSLRFIFDELSEPPYGLRLGVFPVILAVAFREFKKILIIRDRSGVEKPLDADLIELMIRSPDSFSVQVMTIDHAKQVYLEQLGEMYREYQSIEDGMANQAYSIAVAMKKWFVSLPKYTRESRLHSETTRRIRRILDVPISDSSAFLFSDIPWAVTDNKGFQAEQVDTYVAAVRQGKSEMEVHLALVRTQLEETTKQLLGGASSNCPLVNVLFDWYQALGEDTKSYAFSGSAFNLLKLAGQLGEKIDVSPLDEIIKMIVDLNPADWSDDTRTSFETELKETVALIKSIDSGYAASDANHKVVFVDSTGQLNERVYANVEVGELGEILYSSLENTLDGFAGAIDLKEKRQVLLDLLRKMS